MRRCDKLCVWTVVWRQEPAGDEDSSSMISRRLSPSRHCTALGRVQGAFRDSVALIFSQQNPSWLMV